MKNISGEKQKVIAVSYPNSLMEFGVDVIDQVIAYAHLVFDVEDVIKYADIWQKKHAFFVLEIFQSIFHDIEHIYDTCDGQSDDEDSDEQEIANWEQII